MPGDGNVLTLEQLHAIVREIWLTRHDEELEQEKTARREGRPQSTKQIRLEELKMRELEEYRTGMGTFFFSPSDFWLIYVV
jgi:translation machinery-associated protein 16